jgi:hypothetical protein
LVLPRICIRMSNDGRGGKPNIIDKRLATCN